MLEDLPDVPPAVPLLLSEVVAKSQDWDDARRRLKALLPELKNQSEVYEADSFVRSFIPIAPERLDVYLDGSLNLFDPFAGCSELDCRKIAAIRLARSIGLIADTIWITDYLTERFCRFGRVTNQKLDNVMADIVVLGELWPLIRAGVIKFRSPSLVACQDCMSHFNEEVEKITHLLFEEYSAEFSVQSLDPGSYSIYTGNLYQPPLYRMVNRKHPAHQHLLAIVFGMSSLQLFGLHSGLAARL
ncbi:MAG: hypothetical protein K0S36_1366 [Nitrosospira multiformis]|jgi:hypothetical protein|nr:hypothetical protein [Nitrosospira multiformis]